MKKVVLIFGVISGLILAVFGYLLMYLCGNDTISMDRGMLIGYTSMAVALSMIFFGIKSYRDNYSRGTITFWKGLQVGLLITLLASFFYFAGALVYSQTHPDLVDKMMSKYVTTEKEKMEQRGAPQKEIDDTIASMTAMIKAMENPFLFYAICLMEMAPVGIIISLFSAAVLRKKDVLPAAPAMA